MLVPEGFFVDGLPDVVKFVEDEPTAAAYIQQLCVLVVATVDGLAYLEDEVFVSDL
jgi:hypothetical protein